MYVRIQMDLGPRTLDRSVYFVHSILSTFTPLGTFCTVQFLPAYVPVHLFCLFDTVCVCALRAGLSLKSIISAPKPLATYLCHDL